MGFKFGMPTSVPKYVVVLTTPLMIIVIPLVLIFCVPAMLLGAMYYGWKDFIRNVIGIEVKDD